MTRESILIALGVLIAAAPYLGLPLSLLGILLPILGLLVAAIGVSQRTRKREVSVYDAPEA